MTVLVSYAREDTAAAQRLAAELRDDGICCVVDPELAQGDPFWRESLARHFPSVSLLVGLHSAAAAGSPWVEQEQRAYDGPRCWIALDATPAPQAMLAPSEALPAIRARVRGGSRVAQSAQPATAATAAERAGCFRRERARLDDWLHALPARRPMACEIDGDRASIGDGLLELRRVPGERSFLGTQPVTNRQYRAFVDASGWPPPPTWQRAEFNAADAPVTGITWFDAVACAAWFGGELPTEAAWARAAHAGDAARRYATASGAIDDDGAHFGQPFGAAPPLPALAKAPNPAGFHGLCGNSWDWCATAWGAHRAIRGGGSMDSAAFCAIGARYRNAPVDRDCCVGMRVLLRSAAA